MTASVLVINSGSSSVKFAVYRSCASGGLERILHGQIEDIERAPHFSAHDPAGSIVRQPLAAYPDPDQTREAAFSHLLAWLQNRQDKGALVAAGHRVVHGGARFCEPVVIDSSALAALDALVPLAPLHQGHNVAGIRAMTQIAPDLPQVACFDTAFHATQTRLATLFALPAELTDLGLRRYGFHGLSYEYVASVLPDYLGAAAEGKVIVAHLGNGASLCAMRNRRSVATSMGFSPLDGLVMGTRPGSLDPGVLIYLIRERGMDADAIADLLYHRSGLLGVSGGSHDMRILLSSRETAAAEAIELFVYRAVSQIGALAAVLGGLDSLVFTAGIGEHASIIRKKICDALLWVGLEMDDGANAKHGPCLSMASSRCSAWVIPTDEELVIAGHALRLVKTQHG